jgi:hypothetical protein
MVLVIKSPGRVSPEALRERAEEGRGVHDPEITHTPGEHYGSVGWRELLRVRRDLLDKYDSAKEYNASRPVQTEHGNVGEATVREWLRTFLPLRYGVTSGFIIPGIVVKEYVLLHYDVIIYDKINSPILWIDDNPDLSDQGKKQAIPAEHVHAVFEVKATLTRRHAIDALAKLSQLNMFRGWLPTRFVSLILFFELDVALADRRYILKHFDP